MKTTIASVLIVLLITSCVPYKVAPKFRKEDYKVVKAKKFKRKLPNETSFIFKDPKDADEFYKYVDTKFQLNGLNVDSQVEFNLDGNNYYLSFSETEIEDKALNLPLILVDAKREQNGNEAIFADNHISRVGHWYLILTVYDNELKNCLSENYHNRSKIIQYLKGLKQEYLTTHNYEELLFEKKS